MEPQVRIFVFREGFLSRFGHDLQLSARQFDIRVQDRAITGRFWADMVRVDGVLQQGTLQTSGLSHRDRMQIEQTIRDEILQSETHPDIVFEGAVQPLGGSSRYAIEGQLRLLATERSITLTAFERGGTITAEVMLTPSMWGIRPYRALGGGLRLKDRIKVEIELPVDTDGSLPDALHWTSQRP